MNIQRCIFLFAIAMSGVVPARATITQISDPSVASEIGTRIRWGGTGWEAAILDVSPFNPNPSLYPVGTPVWQLNLAYPFQISFDGATGTLTLSVDFNRDTTFGTEETITQNVFAAPDGLTSYAGYGFNYLSISGNESGGSTARSQITNLVINGTPLSNIVPNGTFFQNFYADSPVNPMTLITITGDLTFLTAGTSDERPSWNFNFKGPALPVGACAILGDEEVIIGGGTKMTATDLDICSNGPLRTGASVTVNSNLKSRGDISLGNGTVVTKDAFANGNVSAGAKVRVGFDDGPGDLDVDAGGNISLAGGTLIEGECQYDGMITKGPSAGCGSEQPDTSLPIANLYDLPDCAVTAPAPGSPSISTSPTVTTYCTTPLLPGDYGNVSFGSSNCVALASGDYHFQSLVFGPKTRVEILGPVKLHVVDKLLFKDGVQEVLAGGVMPADVIYYVNGVASADPEQRLGAQTVLYGTLCGPGSAITIGDGSDFIGKVIGKTVKLGAGVTFTAP